MITRLFVKALTIIDFSYLHSRRGLLGESWILDVILTGDLNDQAMILDFAEVKKKIKTIVDRHYDHKLLVPLTAKEINIDAMESDYPEIIFQYSDNTRIKHRSPQSALCLLDIEEITPKAVAQVMCDMLLKELPSNVRDLDIVLRPEEINAACFQYSHGLKYHQGNCQRIAHGHRSRIEIYRNGIRDNALEVLWAKRLGDIYLATEADLKTNIKGQYYFSYRGSQGEFSLQLPGGKCYLIENETTVENLARHIVEQLKKRYNGDRFIVYAYEGIGKGAVAERA